MTMKNKLISIITAGVMLSLTQVANADNCAAPCSSNWYLAASGSVAWHNGLKAWSDEDDINLSVNYKTGWGAAASVGYIFELCNEWDLRVEEEFLFRRNKL